MRGNSKHKLPDELKLRKELKLELRKLKELEAMFPNEGVSLNVLQDTHKI